MHLFLALFWFAIGVTLQINWPDIDAGLRRSGYSLNRTWVGLLCFVLFSYNFFRWRLARMRRRDREANAEPRPSRRRPDRDPDPTFDYLNPPKQE